MSSVVVVGAAGFVGAEVVRAYRSAGHEVLAAGRVAGLGIDVTTPNAEALRSIVNDKVDQVVVCAQLGLSAGQWIVELVDGPRWLVCSSAQLNNATPAPSTEMQIDRERIALARGATVLRPTMMYGHGRDANISTLIRRAQRFGIAAEIAGGRALVQPIHVDDVVAAMTAVLTTPALVAASGRGASNVPYSLGGSEAVPVHELLGDIAELLGRNVKTIPISRTALRLAERFAPLVGLRPAKLRRLTEDKTVDNTVLSRATGWAPIAHAIRLEQAVQEVTAPTIKFDENVTTSKAA